MRYDARRFDSVVSFGFLMHAGPGFVLDINQDIRGINDLAVRSHCTGQIILGGGLVKVCSTRQSYCDAL